MNLVFHISEDGFEIELKHLRIFLNELNVKNSCRIHSTYLSEVILSIFHASAVKRKVTHDFL